MRHVVVSLSHNQIKLSSIEKAGFNSVSAEVSSELLEDSTIKSPNALAGVIKDLMAKIGVSLKSADLTFLAEPESVFLRFVTLPKHDQSLDDLIVSEVKAKFPEFNIAESYFAYEKIAPFVFQFVGTSKLYLETLVQVSDVLNMPLVAVIPWVSVLPKYVNTKDPSIFIAGDTAGETVALSELGGIFFSDKYSTEGKKFDLGKTVSELSVYRKDKPIKHVYALNYQVPEMTKDFVVTKLDFNTDQLTEAQGFETNLLAHFVLDAGEDLDECRTNILNLLPLPTVEKRPLSIVKVGSIVTAVIAVMLFGLFMTSNLGAKNKDDAKNLADAGQTTDSAVLSTQDVPETAPVVEEPKAPELKKSDLTIRIENGSGINGMAAKTQTALEAKGYKVASIGTAETTSAPTVLFFKKNKIDFRKLLETDLATSYGELKVEDTLAESETYDVLFVIGTGVKQ